MNDDNSYNVLSKVYPLLMDEKIIHPGREEKVIQFEHPDELMKLIDFSLNDNDKPLTNDEIESICRKMVQYSVRTSHHNFHNQLFAGVDPIGLAGAWITEALNTSQYTFEVGPTFTLIETNLIQKCLDLFGFKSGDGIFTPGGSISNMYGMVLARFKAAPCVKSTGLSGLPPLVAYTSDEAHYSIKKGVHWLGIGTENLVIVETDAFGAMIPEELEKAIKMSVSQGKMPFFVNATAGTTVLGAFDDFHKLAKVCRTYNIWLHVDACLGGTATFSSRHRHLLQGINEANSMSWNPHKTLGAPLQCSLFLTREKGLLHHCNSANATYLFQQDKFYDMSYDTGDKSVQCGRKVDAFKFWLMYKSRGNLGFEKLIDNAFECAEHLVKLIVERDGFRLVIPDFKYTNVCFWFIPKRLRNAEENKDWWTEIYKITTLIKERMVKRGDLMIGYSPLPHKGIGNFFRMVVTCHPPKSKLDMLFIIDSIEKYGDDL